MQVALAPFSLTHIGGGLRPLLPQIRPCGDTEWHDMKVGGGVRPVEV